MTTIGGGDGELEVELMTYGARVHAIRVPLPGGGRREVVAGLPDRAAYEEDRDYRGATVGRYANRIAGAQFELDGVRHVLAANEGPHLLHGGVDGFDSRDWVLADHGPRHAELGLVSEAGDQGFPGRLEVTARFEVRGAELHTTYAATTDAPTHVNLASHAYYRLDADGSSHEHRITVHADRYTPTDEAGIPTGEPRPVRGTPYDLDGSRVGDVVAADDPGIRATHGLDHNFVLRGSGLRSVAVLQGRDLRLELDTDQPGLQVFTGGGRVDGVAMEPQHFPDSPHHPEWPSTVLRPGEAYRWTSVVRVLPVRASGG